MKILIVDDSDPRRISLSNFLLEKKVVCEEDLYQADCIDSAKDLLKIVYFDVLILDVVLPKRVGEKANAKIGLEMLDLLTRSSLYKKPEKIIGITAHLDDISVFRDAFNDHCLAIVEAGETSIGWKTKLVNSLNYTSGSKIYRSIENADVHVLTVYGIRTFGGWQNRLKLLIDEKISGIGFSKYQYGYFPVVDFLIPFVRNSEVRRLAEHLIREAAIYPGKKFIIFAHSFGTLLIAEALKICRNRQCPITVTLLVLSGSVLVENYDWRFLHKDGTRIINECADDDYILYMSGALVLGTGMAGRTGFFGFQNNLSLNRFYQGGHSSYFDGDEFMRNNWVSLLDLDSAPNFIDKRVSSVLKHDVLDNVIRIAGKIKGFIYLSLGIYLILKIFKKYYSLF
jgi:CheY-like chemotaxis protein